VQVSVGEGERELGSLRLPRWGRVVAAVGIVPWQVVDPDGRPVEPIERFLRDFVARGNRPGSVRSYAYVLLRWWRWLMVRRCCVARSRRRRDR
jgi:integrase/recombinase XerD